MKKQHIESKNVIIGESYSGDKVAVLPEHSLVVLRDTGRVVVNGLDSVQVKSEAFTESLLKVYQEAIEKGQSPYPLGVILDHALDQETLKNIAAWYPRSEYTWRAYHMRSDYDTDEFVIQITKKEKPYAIYHLTTHSLRRVLGGD